MKKIVCVIVLLAVFSNTCLWSQIVNDSLSKLMSQESGEYLLAKAKRQKTAGLVMGIGGLVLLTVGGAIAMNEFSFGLDFSDNSGRAVSSDIGAAEILCGVGAISTIASIPVLISSSVNKKRAKLALSNQTTYITQSFQLKQTGVTLAIPLGR
ncbi:MAG: hypothetical protein EON98_14990 [Chitinophagaceae bacterium]|nr:MAG: hypothetical protein EON98_14990 [Chitinophagaceae bacterium]